RRRLIGSGADQAPPSDAPCPRVSPVGRGPRSRALFPLLYQRKYRSNTGDAIPRDSVSKPRAARPATIASVGKQKPGIKKAQVGQPRLRAQLSVYHFAV